MKNELIAIENGNAILDLETSKSIAEFERKIKELKEAEETLKQNILDEMRKKNILKIETEEMVISYIAPSDRETFDSKRFRAEHADLFDEYVKMSPVKASVRVKLK